MSSKIIIVGGGLSGTLVAIELARIPHGPEIILIEKNPEMLGRGVAYQHDFTHQPLNVVAGGMSLFADKPADFVEWLGANHFRYNHLIDAVSPGEFIPRKIFGDYVIENLDRVHREAAGRFQIRIDEAISVLDFGAKKTVVLSSGTALHADHVILALGNFPPADLFEESDPVRQDSRYYTNPWSDKVYSHIRGDENIMLVGTGLTAVDVVLGLYQRKFGGKITMLSRRGRLPLPHDLSAPPVSVQLPEDRSPRSIFLWLRALMRSMPGTPWPAIMDGLRPHISGIWSGWSVEEKRYFMRRLRPFWEVARHRIPANSSRILSSMIDSGQLSLERGAIISGKAGKDGIGVTWNADGKTKSGVFSKVINCTGPESNYRKVRFPIIRDLMERGKVMNDELGLGIRCDAEGRIINEKGTTEAGLWCIGPMRKAALWETTALREIREQAAQLATLTAHV